jgi:hypothetical protein
VIGSYAFESIVNITIHPARLDATMQFPHAVPSDIYRPGTKAATIAHFALIIHIVPGYPDFPFQEPVVIPSTNPLIYFPRLRPRIFINIWLKTQTRRETA